ncbi:MAG: septum site-determining protein MinC [Candidatus Poribacteria bacterium]|jgi:septum site-determining protein MinC|nr:septum site-determining protein MinC [Candidatus Poribacteria bacterium]MDP6748694.1 septum site-determining protein MinC [Candidatus Poribacteria bacterium]
MVENRDVNDSIQAIPAHQIVELKGFRDGLRLMIDASASIEEIRVSVKERMANLGDSLAGTSIVIDTGGQELAAPDLEHLKSLIFETYGLEIVTDPESPAPTPDIQEDKQQKAKKEDLKSTKPNAAAAADSQSDVDRIIPTKRKTKPTAKAEATTPLLTDLPNREATHVIRYSLRSGQVERFFEGTLILFGDVNPGAEVIAGGDIVVLGRLRGLAHAGALGNTSAIIMAMNLTPTQLRIGHLITRPPSTGIRWSKPQPEIARVENDNIVVEPFNGF